MSWKKTEKDIWTLKENILMSVVGIAFFLNILFPFFNLVAPISDELMVLGVVFFGLGCIFVVLSIMSLRRRGVSGLIETGIYGVVRHPMYVGAMILFFSHPFMIQSWVVLISAVVAILCMYGIILSGDKRNLEKFGEDYINYKQSVPAMNFFVGIYRWIRRQKR